MVILNWLQAGGSPSTLRYSGNPGYIPGQPVMAGNNITNGSVYPFCREIYVIK